MKRPLLILGSSLMLLCASCGNKTETVTLQNGRDTLSWALGMSLAKTANSGMFDLDNDLVRQAFESCLNNEKQPIDDETYSEACQYLAFLTDQYQRKEAQKKSISADEIQNEAFTKLLAEKPNLKKASEGYYYEVVKAGKGPKAKIGQRIKFDFKSSNMLTGEVIEETRGNREPIIHVLGNPMFQGILSGIQLMQAGSTYRFYFPYNLVTGANGVPQYTPVIYEVELHEIFND